MNSGLAKICKLYGGMKVTDSKGKTVEWVYDHDLDKPVIKKSKWKGNKA